MIDIVKSWEATYDPGDLLNVILLKNTGYVCKFWFLNVKELICNIAEAHFENPK